MKTYNVLKFIRDLQYIIEEYTGDSSTVSPEEILKMIQDSSSKDILLDKLTIACNEKTGGENHFKLILRNER